MAARWGSDVLDFFRVPNLVAGISIHVPGHALPVDDACGGIAASVFLSALAAMFVLWMRRPRVHSLLLLASALYWALILNVLRVVAVSYAAVAAQLDISVGWRGWALTLGLYAVGILLLWATDRLLIFLLLPSPETELDDWNAKELEDADQLRDESESDAAPDGGRGSCAPTFGAD